MKVQQPSKVIVHYWNNNPILRDKNDYNLWYRQLTDEYYNIIASSLGETAPDCSDHAIMTGHILDTLKNGGIYINDTVIITQNLHKLRFHSLAAGVVDRSKPLAFSNLAFVIAKKGEANLENLRDPKLAITDCVTSGKGIP